MRDGYEGVRGEQGGERGAGGAGGTWGQKEEVPPPGAVWRQTASSRQKVVMTSSYQQPLRDKTVFVLGVLVNARRWNKVRLGNFALVSRWSCRLHVVCFLLQTHCLVECRL